jgi:hypothetical protein
MGKVCLIFAVCLIRLGAATADDAAGFEPHDFPRLMGMNIARPVDYDKPACQQALSRMDIAILGFWTDWHKSKPGITERDVVVQLKQRNPRLLVGQYTVLNESKDADEPKNSAPDISRKLDSENWWLRDASGRRVRWTERYRAWDINISEWMQPDEDGLRYPQWLARRYHRVFFATVPEFDIWYFDNALSRPPANWADWDGDGRNESRQDPKIAAAYRRGNVLHWEEARKLSPQAIFIGNSDDLSSPEYSARLQGVFLEAMMGRHWSIESRHGWDAMMRRYRSALLHTAIPHIVGFNVWGRKDDYRRMRFGLGSCLLDDGYFSYTDEQCGYGSVAWFDEYDAKLGRPLDPPAQAAWQNQIYRRRFERGLVLVNPEASPRTVTLESGYLRLKGNQAPAVNDGEPVSRISLAPHDGIILLK